LRSAEITGPASLALPAFLQAQQAPYLTAVIRATRLPGGQGAVRIGFASPRPPGLLATASPRRRPLPVAGPARASGPLCFPFMIVIVAGVAGSGKTTVGIMLADRLRWRFADADAFHSQANIAKMRSGVPLTDADRGPWLAAIAAWMDERIAAGESAIAGCSALKQSSRDELLTGRPAARVAFLEISRDLAGARLVARHGHFFTAALLDSQFAALEPPQETEQLIVLDATATPDRLVAEIIGRFGLTAGQT
jgi:gluconokinase